jgi:hypothetical protein
MCLEGESKNGPLSASLSFFGYMCLLEKLGVFKNAECRHPGN